jgi:hypothetical protein
MLDPKLRQRPTEFFGLRLHPRHFADQVANHADQIGMTPPPPGNLPRLHKIHPNPLLQKAYQLRLRRLTGRQ